MSDHSEAVVLVNRAIEIELSDDGTPEDAERLILRALELDPECLEALEEAAHFYYAVDEQIPKAKLYARKWKERAGKVSAEMDEILSSPGQP